jgi:hypothetical protein
MKMKAEKYINNIINISQETENKRLHYAMPYDAKIQNIINNECIKNH